MHKEQFGTLLTILRKKKGISQKEMADRLSVSASAVSKWEHGKNLPDMTMISSIADIFQVSCDDLHNPERTLEKLAAFESSRKDAEEKSAEEVPKKKYSRIAGVFALIGTAAAGILLLLHMTGQGQATFQKVCARYIEDSTWGKVYEIAYVVDAEITNDSINVHLDEVRDTLKQEVIDTDIVKTAYYDSKEAALAWRKTDMGGYVFLNVE